jgi:hypothetical protein
MKDINAPTKKNVPVVAEESSPDTMLYEGVADF